MRAQVFVLSPALLLAAAYAQSSGLEPALQQCGDAMYTPDKYYCFNGNFLCPILNHEATLKCGDGCYLPSQYTCYNGDFLCPIQNGQVTLQCGDACYTPQSYSCNNGELYPAGSSPPPSSTTSAGSGGASPTSTPSPSTSRSTSTTTTITGTITVLPSTSSSATATAASSASTCTDSANTFHLSDPPYQDYFYSDCNSASQVVITSPESSSNLSLIGPRLLVAWPAGNSGVVTYFAPTSGINGTLGIALQNFTSSSTTSDSMTLQPVFIPANSSSLTGNPRVGITGLIHFNASATLVVPLLGSVRTMRDFTEGPSILRPEIQDAITYGCDAASGTCTISRIWFDNMTTTMLSFTAQDSDASVRMMEKEDGNSTLVFSPGVYLFNATFDYPQLTALNASTVLNPGSQDLIGTSPSETASLAFLSYSNKLLAGGWRFLTYFGRDSMISLLLLQDVLSTGQSGAIEAVIGAVLERVNHTDGAVCHEETIGDYATWVNQQKGLYGDTNATCAYPMIDTDLYLPIVMANYFVATDVGQSRRDDFFAQTATLPFGNEGLSYYSLALTNAQRIMAFAAPFAAPGGQTLENLHHLLDDQIVGQWRDSTYGIGGGRYPFDVNTALMPAALRAIADLVSAGFFPNENWSTSAAQYAQVWEDSTLSFFRVDVPQADAVSLVENYVSESSFSGPSNTANIGSNVSFYAISLDGNNNQSVVRVMHTDTAFRLYLVNSTNDAQLTQFLNATATSVLQQFPLGLLTDAGLLVANPAYGGDPIYAANWTHSDYHGTVIWGWPMSMTAKGLERQLERCASSSAVPAFCQDNSVHDNVLRAYNALWDVIDANRPLLTQELWSWEYADGKFQPISYGAVSTGESDVVQLWSLTYLAVTRNQALANPS